MTDEIAYPCLNLDKSDLIDDSIFTNKSEEAPLMTLKFNLFPYFREYHVFFTVTVMSPHSDYTLHKRVAACRASHFYAF